MAAPLMDERAPGVTASMRRRIAAALDAGERPTLRGKNLRLGSISFARSGRVLKACVLKLLKEKDFIDKNVKK